jgi:hypothetical protein
MERPINESDRILNLQPLIERFKLEKSEECLELIQKEIDFLVESNACLKDYVITNADNINREYFSYPVLVRKVLEKENFTMVRYQDGEWTCMLKVEPHFTNKIPKYGEEIDPLGDQMLEIIKSKPTYYISTLAGTFYERAAIAWPFLRKLKNFYVGEVFRRKSVEEGLDEFVNALKTRTVILVGPNWLSPLQNMFDNTHVICPFGTLFKEEEMKKLDDAVHEAIKQNIDKNPVILYSCSIPAKIMAHKYWGLYEKNITQIDMGAIWDPYCGKKTRPYHEKVLARLQKTE